MQGTLTIATGQGGKIGYVGIGPHGLDCCVDVAMAKAQRGMGFAHRLDVRISFEAFSYRGETAGPGQLGGGVAVFGEIVFGEAWLDVGVSVMLEFWDEALGGGEVNDEV